MEIYCSFQFNLVIYESNHLTDTTQYRVAHAVMFFILILHTYSWTLFDEKSTISFLAKGNLG